MNSIQGSVEPAGMMTGIEEEGMFTLLRRLLEGWLSIPCVNIGPVSEWPPQMPLERMVVFSGSLSGCLVLRAPLSLQGVLQEGTVKEGPGGRVGGEEDLFSGLTALYFSHLAALSYDGNKGMLEVYQPAVSNPAMWPDRKPRVAFTVLAGTLPVEVRIWINDGEPDR
jgi:hypothetical protein